MCAAPILSLFTGLKGALNSIGRVSESTTACSALCAACIVEERYVHEQLLLCACRFARGQLIEVNAHSLFSKWFSESGKLVSRLFVKITELVSACLGDAFQHRRASCRVCHQTPHLKKALAPANHVSGMQVEEEDSLVCVLLDEVESLTRARSAAVSGSEPADAIRAVNALLTQVLSLQKGVVASALSLPGVPG